MTDPRNFAPTLTSRHTTRARNDLVVLAIAHERRQLDEALMAAAMLAFAVAFFALRRWQDLKREVTRRRAAEAATERLQGLLPICAGCKKIRDDAGSWVAVEVNVSARTAAAFTHGICPDCRSRLYPDIDAPPATVSAP